MKYTNVALILLIFLTAGCSSTKKLSSFEGVVSYKVSSAGSPDSEFIYYIKDGKCRAEGDGPNQLYTIGDFKQGTVVTVFPDKKTYRESKFNTALQSGAWNGTIKRTGKKDVLLGRNCEEIDFESGEGKIAMWGDDAMYEALAAAAKSAKTYGDFLNAVKFSGHFALKSIQYDSKGKILLSMVADKIDEKPLDDGLFLPPVGFAQTHF